MNSIGLRWSLALAVSILTGCRPAPEALGSKATSSAQAASPDSSSKPTQPPADSPAAAHSASAPYPAALQQTADVSESPILISECPGVDGGTEDEIAAQASALVPLKPGLTLSTTWSRTTEADEVECLTHVRGVDATAVAVTASCGMRDGTQTATRRECRADLRSAYMFSTGAGDEPDVLKGATMLGLSKKSFGELKAKGATRHRNVTMYEGRLIGDLDGALSRQGTGRFAATVNDRVVELPVIRAAGTLRGTAMGKPVETRVEAAILNDERFPLILEYALRDIGTKGFSVRYTKLSYPTDGELEERLASTKQVDVYGIYFDVASDRIREESEPALREIADALAHNPDWTLSIDGHTDSVGGAAYNLDLSRRRSEAVRAALVERYAIAAVRLTTRGLGASQPKDTNDTTEGRARNRRVELRRR
jgi:outer membrane protein OmpA-like peptidoglycan-associated protein